MCPSASDNSAFTGRTSWKFYIWRFFDSLSRKFKCDWNNARITGASRGDLCTFVKISHWMFLTARNVWGKNCWENQNSHFMFNNSNPTPNIVPLMRQCGKTMVGADGPQTTIQYGTGKMRIACRITTAEIQTHTQNMYYWQCPRQQWLREPDLMLCFTNIAYLVECHTWWYIK